jgi:hypothetical protein
VDKCKKEIGGTDVALPSRNAAQMSLTMCCLLLQEYWDFVFESYTGNGYIFAFYKFTFFCLHREALLPADLRPRSPIICLQVDCKTSKKGDFGSYLLSCRTRRNGKIITCDKMK